MSGPADADRFRRSVTCQRAQHLAASKSENNNEFSF